MTIPRFAPAAVLALVLALPAQAGAVIQPQRSISGITIGMTPKQVRAALGTPTSKRTVSNIFGRQLRYRYAGGVLVAFQGRTNVTAITLTGDTDRTATGVGIGSTEAEVRAGLRGERCDTFQGVRSCHLGSFTPGRRITDFTFGSSGRVVRVTLGIVID
jgi:opacity protein-like surface antigen